MKHFIGIDLGTQSMKGILLAPDGRLLSTKTASYYPDFPRANWCEQDAAAWENALAEIVPAMVQEAGISPADVGALGFASQCGGLVPVGRDGRPVRKAILWLDRRAEPQCDAIRSQITDDECLHLIGSSMTSTLRAPKILWMRDNEPELYEKTAWFLEVGEYMVYHLTGALTSDFAHTSITALFDVGRKEWSQRMLDITGIDPDKLGKVMAAADVAGTLLPERAKALGLSEQTAVVVGSGDQHAGSIGSGLVGPGQILNIMGTSEIVAGAFDHPVYDEVKLLKTHLHVDPTLWQIEQGSLISGACVRWYVDNVARMGYDELNEAAAKVPAGSDGLVFFPALSGSNSPVINGYARGMFFGLTMSHTLPHMTRALYEGNSYAFRDNIERLVALGMTDCRVIATGGGTRSSLWMQIKADLIGMPIQVVDNPEPTALGAAMLAGVAMHNFKDFGEAASCLLRYGRTYEPDPSAKAQYDDMYGLYRQLYFTNEPVFNFYKNN